MKKKIARVTRLRADRSRGWAVWPVSFYNGLLAIYNVKGFVNKQCLAGSGIRIPWIQTGQSDQAMRGLSLRKRTTKGEKPQMSTFAKAEKIINFVFEDFSILTILYLLWFTQFFQNLSKPE